MCAGPCIASPVCGSLTNEAAGTEQDQALGKAVGSDDDDDLWEPLTAGEAVGAAMERLLRMCRDHKFGKPTESTATGAIHLPPSPLHDLLMRWPLALL